MLQKYCIALEDIVYWAQLSARAAPRRTGPDTGQDKMLREVKIMVTSLYQSLCNMETIYADHVAIRYYDETKQGVTEVYYRQYAQDLRRFVSFLRSKQGMSRGSGSRSWPATVTTTSSVCTAPCWRAVWQCR